MKTGIRWCRVEGSWRVTIYIAGRIHLNHFVPGGDSAWTKEFMGYLRQWKLPAH